MTAPPSELAALCDLAGVILEYEDFRGERRRASVESQLAILRALGIDIASEAGAGPALEAARAEGWSDVCAPCAVAWGGTATVGLHVPASAGGGYEITVALETGEPLVVTGELADLNVAATAAVHGTATVRRTVQISGLPMGYHRAEVVAGGARGECLIIAAPERAFGTPRGWGVFAPVYALRTSSTMGAGSLADLRALATWTRSLGGNLVGTLPLSAAFYDDPFEPSPYSPASRLFWNELFVDLGELAARFDCPPGRAALEAARTEAAALSEEPLVDYRRQATLVHRVLAAYADWGQSQPGVRSRVAAFVEAHPQVADYARFRAAVDADGPWPGWTGAARAGDLGAAARNPASERYHLFAQAMLEDQLGAFKHDPRLAGLYLDLPVGTNLQSYDVYRDRDTFALGASAGAPPDELFLGGQNWCLPPIDPRAGQKTGHRYFIACARAQMAHASMLRIDHVMGLSRLYWIPEGAPATDGVYVRYPAAELYAILCLESHRQQCAVVGEDLGTVPDHVRPEMARRNIHCLYVAQFGLPGGDGGACAAVPDNAVASLGTHDTPTFAGFWQGRDIDQRVALGLITADQGADEHTARDRTRRATINYLTERGLIPPSPGIPGAMDPEPTSAMAVMSGLTAMLAASPARQVMVTLEDLWLEEKPQNVPGTSHELPNWRRKAARSLEQIQGDTPAMAVLDGLAWARPKIVDQDP